MKEKKFTMHVLVTIIIAPCLLFFALMFFSVRGYAAEGNDSFFDVSGGTAEITKNDSGLKFEILSQRSKVVLDYRNFIEAKDLQSILNFRILPSKAGIYDFKRLNVVLQDALNEEDQVVIAIGLASNWWGTPCTSAKVSLTNDFVADDWGTLKIKDTSQAVVGLDNLIGTAPGGLENKYSDKGTIVKFGNEFCWNTYNGVFTEAPGKDCAEIGFSFNNNIVSLNGLTVADLTDSDFLQQSTRDLANSGKQAEYKKRYEGERIANLFSSSRVKLSIELDGVQQTNRESGNPYNKVSFLLNSLAGQDLAANNFEIQDNSSPAVEANLTSNAVLNFDYRIPQATVYDNLDGDVTDVTVEVYDADGESVSCKNDMFRPNKTGKHTIVYRAKNSRGNISSKTRELNVFAASPDTTITVSGTLHGEYRVGETIPIPSAAAFSEISLLADKSVFCTTVIQKDQKVVAASGGDSQAFTFVPQSGGEYTVVYLAINEIGLVSNCEMRFTVISAPVILIPDLAESYALDSEIILDKNVCFYRDQFYTAEISVFIDGKIVAMNGSDRFTPQTAGTYTIRYTCTVDGLTAVGETDVEVGCVGGSLFDNVSDIKEVSGNVDFPEWAIDGNGVSVVTDTMGAKARYSNTIDLNNLDKNTNLIEFLILSGNGFGSLNRMQIQLIDKYDSSNTVTVTYNEHRDGRYEYSYVNVNYDGRYLCRSAENGGKVENNIDYGSLQLLSMRGHSFVNQKPMNIQFDYGEKQIWIYDNLSGSQWLLLDLDDYSQVGAGKRWKGFTTGEVELQIAFTESSGKNGVIVTEIAGQKLSGALIQDTTAPALYIDAEEDYLQGETGRMPDGKVNLAYAIPSATAYDLVFGAAYVETKLIDLAEGVNITDLISHGRFVPAHAGNYLLQYTSQDRYGNTAVKTLKFEVVQTLAELTAEFASEPEIAYAGRLYTLPQPEVTGGSGNIRWRIAYLLNGNAIKADSLNRLFLSAVGELKLVITVSDYFTESAVRELTIPVISANAPELSIHEVPISAQVGKTLMLPDFTAINYDYEQSDARYNAYRAVYVGNNLIYSVNNGIVTGSLAFALEKNFLETQLKVVYCAGNDPEHITVAKEFYIPVIAAATIADYVLKYDPDKMDSSKWNDSGVETVLNDTYTTFKFTKEKGIMLPNPLIADDLIFILDVDERFNNLKYLCVILEDYANSEIRAVLKIRFLNGAATLEINDSGKVFPQSGRVDDNSKSFTFIYSQTSRAIKDGTGKIIDVMGKNPNGLAFAGFPSGLVKFRVEARGIPSGKTAAVNLIQVSNQSFGTLDPAKDYVDTTQPNILFYGDMKSITVAKGDVINIVAAKAYDVLNPQCDVKLTVRDDRNRVLNGLNGVPCNTVRTLVCAEYGYYTIEYIAREGRSSARVERFKIYVRDDVPPVISVLGEVAAEIGVGETLNIPPATVTDNYDTEIELYVFVQLPSAKIISVEGGYVPTAKGKYKLIYYAYDLDYNVCKTEYAFEAV